MIFFWQFCSLNTFSCSVYHTDLYPNVLFRFNSSSVISTVTKNLDILNVYARKKKLINKTSLKVIPSYSEYTFV